MSGVLFRRGLLVAALALGMATGAVAQTAARLQGFPSADAAANALADAVRKNDQKAICLLYTSPSPRD